ncbi:hypothetical protein L1889_04400 [Paenalcaligenes niemegkensis]|uniref:hypothetical protein n=1 Tax=Paenalcaligenes niemegkensis TaxID=2895469 RepID=UPI001EE8D12C|nr:hypothetical protein [Paenalcaligenes niemegkensis]MCQ9616036.1 hypothetical protein [Paenalcaligenes niemegkensis]
MAIDIGVVLIYAIVIMGFGWLGLHRIRGSEDYLVAGRNLGPGFYVGTMSATVLGVHPPLVPCGWVMSMVFPDFGCVPP